MAMRFVSEIYDVLVSSKGMHPYFYYLFLLVGKGGELTHHETAIIAGALELAEKTASDSVTLLTETFCTDINSKLDSVTIKKVKNLLTIDPENEAPLKSVIIRRIPRLQKRCHFMDGILNEFQKGYSYMAVVAKHCDKTGPQPPTVMPMVICSKQANEDESSRQN
ncbi:hypothetical protein VNO78_03666 [Psophocarpus tetragonolobus]|uniref:Uncharacterized protein n=1 Tax=Psophocarpus tetragonolobus TaxID=3891 RepID=A0AAN9XW48_PSOTE